MKVSPARLAAFDILLRVEKDRAFTSVLLPSFEQGLSDSDRGLCHELVLGTLRRQLWLDRIIENFAGTKQLDPEVRLALRLGTYQLRCLDRIPAYSAINESVMLVQRAKKTSAKGLVNAILRRISADDFPLAFETEIERISVEQSHPLWLVERWAGLLGADEAPQLAAANNAAPPLAFRVIGSGSSARDELVGLARPSNYVAGCYVTATKSLATDLSNGGEIYIQDEGSQMVASATTVPVSGRFLDVCATPGGKTGIIATRAAAPSLVIAGDVHTSRVRFLRGNLNHQNAGNVHIVQYNAESRLPFSSESFDTVLVDAPCSGTGTIRHNPEIRYFITADDLTDLAERQLRILTNSGTAVKPGGRLFYSTCSLETDENEAVAAAFLNTNEGFVSVRLNVDQRFITEKGYARTWPHRDNMDGFFIAAFERRNSSV